MVKEVSTMAATASESEKLNRYNATPLYTQLSNIIRSKISSGELTPGTMIPSENELGKVYGVSRMTIRSVITQLVSEGLLYRAQGKGTFVSTPKLEISGLHYTGIRSQLEEMGHSVATRLLTNEVIAADELLAAKLQISPGEQVYAIQRLRTASGVNISYHKSYVPVRLCPGLNEKALEEEQLCKIISDDYLLTRSRVQETLESYIADDEKAEYLDVNPGFPLILLEDKIYSKDDILFEYTQVYFRGDKVKIRIEYKE